MAGEKKSAPDRVGNPTSKVEKKKFSRRDFVVGSGTAIAGGALAVVTPKSATAAKASDYPQSTMYLVHDSKHCAGCYGCMIACSMAHEGESNLSLSRIQIHRAVLAEYPLDIYQFVCRQCPEPLCVENCPTGAAHISAENGNIRMIDKEKCIGCQTCMKSCPFIPHRPIWNPVAKKATKCDMCVDTPYYPRKGGPGGTQACVEVCPANAVKLVAELPSQTDIGGYDRDLQPPRKAMPKFPFSKGDPKAKSKSSPAKTAPAKKE